MLLDIRPNFADGSDPDAIGWILSIVAQRLQRFGIRHLIPPIANLMAHKNDPMALLSGLLDKFHQLCKVHVIEGRAQRLCEVTKSRVVRRFVEINAPNHKTFRNQRYIALCMPTSSNELLSTGVGKSSWFYPQQVINFGVRCIELLLHHRQRVILKGVVATKLIVSSARMRHRVIANFVSVRYGLAPAIQTLFNLVALKEKRHLHAMLAE